MTQLNYQIPIVGNPNSSEDPKVHDALSQIQTVVNGGLDSGNITDGSIAATDLEAAETWRVVGAVSQPAFQNSWVQELAFTTPATAFYKDVVGIVHLKGVVKNGTINLPIFTLPAGYRPLEDNHQFAVWSLVGGGGPILGRVDVMADGRVIPGDGSNGRITLSGVSFRAEQ